MAMKRMEVKKNFTLLLVSPLPYLKEGAREEESVLVE